MAIPLKLDTATGDLRQLLAADALEAIALEPRTTTVDLVIGSTLTGGARILMGNPGNGVQIADVLDLQNFLELTEISAPGTPAANDGRLYMKTADDGLFWKPESGVEVDLTDSGGSTLQEAYEGGNTIAVITAEGAIAFSNSADVTDVLQIARTFVGAGDGIQLTMGAGGEAVTGRGIDLSSGSSATGTLLFADNLGSGNALQIQDGGADVLVVDAAGAIDLTPSSGQNLTMTVLGAGIVDIDAAGAINLDSSAAGISLDAAAASNFSTSVGDLTFDAATGELVLSHAGGITRVVGDLVVDGTTTTVDSETVLVADNHLYLNAGYTTAAAETGGLVVNYLPIATTDTVNGSYVAGVPATSNPTVTTTGSATFAVGQFIQFSGADDNKNEGLYEVLSHSGTTLEIRGVGNTATVEDFTQNQFEAVSDNGAAITRVSISVLRAGTDGLWEIGNGSTTAISFSDIGTAGGNSLQQAYVQGNAITATAAEGPFLVNASDAVSPLTIQDGGTDILVVDSAGAVDITPLSNQAITLTTLGTGSIDLSAADAFSIAGGAASTISTSAGNLTIDAAAAELVFDDTGGSGITLSQSGDRTLVQTATGEILNGVTSIIGALNALATAMDASGQAGIRDYVVENGVTITAGDVVAQGTVAGRATQGNANAAANIRLIGVALTTGTGDVGGTVTVRVALPGNFISDSGGSFTAGDALYMPDGTGRANATAPTGTGDFVKRVGWAHSATEYMVDPSVGVTL